MMPREQIVLFVLIWLAVVALALLMFKGGTDPSPPAPPRGPYDWMRDE